MLPILRHIWPVCLILVTSACGGTTTPGVPTTDPENLTTASGATVGIDGDALMNGGVQAGTSSAAAPSALLAVQQDATLILGFAQADGFAAAPRAFDALPTGSASYAGVLTVSRENPEVYGRATGQLRMTADFGADVDVSGSVANFVYVPPTATLLDNPIGARGVPGALTLSGRVANAAAGGEATAVIPVDVAGSVELPLGEFDFSGNHSVDLRGTVRGRVADGAFVLDGGALGDGGETLLLDGIGVQ